MTSGAGQISPSTHGLRVFIEQAVVGLGNRDDAPHEGLIFAGEVHDTHPRAILLDSALQPTDINLYLVLKTESDPRQGRPFPSYTYIQQTYRLARGTVAKAIAVLRLTRWITVISRVRDAGGKIRGNVYVVHSTPMALPDTLFLDESYLDFIAQSIGHANAQVSRVASVLHRQFADAVHEDFDSTPLLESPTTIDRLGATVATHAPGRLAASVFAIPGGDTTISRAVLTEEGDSLRRPERDGCCQVQFLNLGGSGRSDALVRNLNLAVTRLVQNLNLVVNRSFEYSVQNLNLVENQPFEEPVEELNACPRTHAPGSSTKNEKSTTTTTTTASQALNESPARERGDAGEESIGADASRNEPTVRGADTQPPPTIPDNVPPHEIPFVLGLIAEVPVELRQNILFEWAGMRRAQRVRNPLGLLASFCRKPDRVAITEYGRSEASRHESNGTVRAADTQGVPCGTGSSVSSSLSAPWTPLPEFIERLAATVPDSYKAHIRAMRALVNEQDQLRFNVPNDHFETLLNRWELFPSTMDRLLAEFGLTHYSFHVGS